MALEKSIEIRTLLHYDVRDPISIYEVCERLNVGVRFVGINMEGMYVREESGGGTILLSSLRPASRRTFTCAHELGHHVFAHGSRIDHLAIGASALDRKTDDEFLVDAFAGFMLMPSMGIRRAFTRRSWRPETANERQIYTVACNFGVGYETLVTHMTYVHRSIPATRANVLLKSSPKSIRRDFLGSEESRSLIVVDEHWELPTIDVEVGDVVVLLDTVTAPSGFDEIQCVGGYTSYRIRQSGISRVTDEAREWSAFVRAAPKDFVGLARYRHLEDAIDE